MQMNRGGFSILETMVVLMVTGGILTASVIIFGSQQRVQQYKNATKDIEVKVQDVMNDVAVGNYGALDSATCIADPTNGPQIDTTIARKSGTNQGCIFMGKAIQFQTTRMVIMTLVGNRYFSGTTPASTFAQTKPVVDPSSITYYDYQYGVQVYNVNPAGSALIVFGTTPNNTLFVGGDASKGYNSGTQQVLSYASGVGSPPVDVTAPGAFLVDNLKPIFSSSGLAWPTSTNKVTFCLQDSASGISGRQYSGMIISGGTSSLSVQREEDKAGAVC